LKKINELPEFSRPREKLKERGPDALTDAELVAAILGHGNRDTSVMMLATKVAKLIAKTRGNLTVEALAKVDGIGLAKACQLLAAFELARRYAATDVYKISKAADVLPLLQDIAAKQQEHFVCISINGANEVIQKRIITVGLLDRSQVHPREVFADVLTDRAAAVIFAHNHPSGDLRPSDSDLRIHNQLVESANILGLRVLDDIIVGKKGYYSFQEAGLVKN
jgi:DNA repair protein RadC